MKLKVIVALSMATTLLTFMLASYSFVVAHRNACDARDQALNVIADILTSAQAQTDANPRITRQAKDRSADFVTASLNRINQARC